MGFPAEVENEFRLRVTIHVCLQPYDLHTEEPAFEIRQFASFGRAVVRVEHQLLDTGQLEIRVESPEVDRPGVASLLGDSRVPAKIGAGLLP